MSQPVDYEKQFQADLERAQALSLESLALDKYRMQKKLQRLQIQTTRAASESSGCEASEISDQDDKRIRSERNQFKSRPRPGSFNLGQSNSIIAPPPSNQRRNSSAAVNITPNNTNDADLISFTSPTQTSSHSSLKDYCDQIHKLAQKNSDLVTFEPNTGLISTGLNNSSTISYSSNFHATAPNVAPSPYGFQSHITSGLSIVPGVQPLNPTYQFPTIVPQIPPLPSIYSRAESYMPTLPCASTSIINSNIHVFKPLSKQNNSNLIDLASIDLSDSNLKQLNDTKNNVRVSVLEIFDPLLSNKNINNDTTLNKECIADDTVSECSGSMYDEYDPFDYLYNSSSVVPNTSDPIYAAVVKSDKVSLSPQSPPPLPPRIARTTLERKNKSFSNYVKKKNRLYENVIVIKKKAINDCELKAFHEMVKNLRGKFMCDDEITNPGYIISPMLNSKYRDGTSIKLTVYNFSQSLDTLKETAPITFTCDISTSVEHVTLHVLCELDQSPEEAHRLQVWGAAEYLAPGTLLEEYEYVHNCIKLEQDVILTLISEKLVDRSLSRTAQDDRRDTNLTLDDMLPSEPLVPISYDDLRILLETLESEMEKVELAAVELSSSSSRSASVAPALQSSGVVQAVKAICSLMGTIETSDISEALELFTTACLQFVPNPRTEVISEEGDYSVISLRNDSHSSVIPDLAGSISSHCERIRGAIQSLIEMYCQAFRVDFQLSSMNDLPTSTKTVAEVADSILVHVCALHRIPNTWKHVDYLVAAQVYHGTRPVGQPVLSIPVTVSNSFYPRVLFDCWLDMEGMSICQLAREARLVLVLYGRILEPAEKDEASSPPKYTKQEIGWASIQFFNYDGILMQGSVLVSLWPPVADKRVGPAPCFGSHPVSEHPLLGIELPGPPGRVTFPSAPPQSPTNREIKCDFSSLDENTQQQLLEIVEQDTLSRPQIESREILWEKRHYLHHLPSALPKVLLAAHSWDWACLSDLHEMLHNWTPMQPVEALQLLLPCFPDMEVRRCAVKWIEPLTNDELIDYLPQLVQALRYDTYEASSLVRFLLERALCSPRVSHHLYWLLTQSLPGQCPQNSGWDEVIQNEMSVGVSRHHRRLLLILRALWTICGEAQRQRFMSQQLLVKSLNEIAENIKQTKESLRLKSMGSALESVNQSLSDNPTCLPLSPSLIVTGVQSWSYFPSNTLPLKINFLAPDMSLIPAIFKAGDDLQQDMLTLQVVRIMDKLWLREGLDLKMVTFSCVPTGFKRGMIELVSSAETLRKIQVEFGLTGSFKDKPIAEWLAKHNPSELEYERAVENFTASCAGYSVVTYILGICDRHNDNIMLKTSGHVFHIDFGKFLGDAQMFGNFKRDRTPFVLTSDMAYVINGGDRPSERFHKFVDLCCQAFNIVRRQSNLILHLFALMVSSGIPGVTADAVNYVRRALLPEQSNAEAAAMFARLIESSLKSWFTQFNFFLHNLAQLRFTGDHGDGELLSFIPKVYSMSSDGRLLSVQVQCYQKRYDPNKHYVYIIRVERVGQPDPTHVLRSYKEFTEFHQKLCVHFPLAKIHSLPTGLHMGRSNIKQVAARRKTDIDLFLHSLFQTADEIAHSPLVYTFFHPLLRDQQPIDIHAKKIKERKVDQRNDIGRVKGELKLSVIYDRGILSVMVQHARSLPLVAGGQEPSTYVKVYLQPDPAKSTKRKTKVVKRSCHPTFMEMLEYRLPLDLIRSRILQATIWNHDPLQENEFLGGVELRLWEMPLEQEETHWFPLKNITR